MFSHDIVVMVFLYIWSQMVMYIDGIGHGGIVHCVTYTVAASMLALICHIQCSGKFLLVQNFMKLLVNHSEKKFGCFNFRAGYRHSHLYVYVHSKCLGFYFLQRTTCPQKTREFAPCEC